MTRLAMNWRRRMVPSKDTSTGACSVALCDRGASEKWQRSRILRRHETRFGVKSSRDAPGIECPYCPLESDNTAMLGVKFWLLVSKATP